MKNEFKIIWRSYPGALSTFLLHPTLEPGNAFGDNVHQENKQKKPPTPHQKKKKKEQKTVSLYINGIICYNSTPLKRLI